MPKFRLILVARLVRYYDVEVEKDCVNLAIDTWEKDEDPTYIEGEGFEEETFEVSEVRKMDAPPIDWHTGKAMT